MRARIPVALIAIVCAASTASAAEATRQVVLERDMTCEQAARKYLGSSRRHDVIHALNDLGPSPHKLKKGMTLNLPGDAPAAPAGPDAKLTAVSGAVRVRPADRTDWDRGQPGNELFRGWRVNTQEKAAAEVTFEADRARVELREQTVIIIYDASAQQARALGGVAVLESGQLRSRLGDLAGKKTVTIDTPSARADLRSGSTLLDVDEGGVTRLSNHEGRAADLTMRKDGKPRGGAVAVKAGMGSKVLPGKLPTPPRPLPSAPAFEDTSRTILATDGKQGLLVASWSPVAGAARYRIEVGREPELREPLALVVVEHPVTRLETRDLPVGRYYVRLTAIDADRFESRPSEATPFDVVALALRGGQVLDAGQRLAISDEIQPPAGLRCHLGEPGRPLVLTRPGQATLRCTDPYGHELPAVVVEVGVPEIRVDMVAGQALSRGQNARLEVAASTTVLPALRLDADAGVAVSEIAASSAGRRAWRVTPGPGAKDTFVVRVVLGEGAEAVVLAEPSVTLWTEPADPEPVVVTAIEEKAESPWFGVILGASGLSFVDGPRIDGEPAEVLGLGRLRLDVYAADLALIELGFLAGPAVAPNATDTYVGGELRFGLAPRWGTFRAILAGGVGIGTLDERRTPFDVTAGFGWSFGTAGGLRIEAEHRWWGDGIRSIGGSLSYVMEM